MPRTATHASAAPPIAPGQRSTANPSAGSSFIAPEVTDGRWITDEDPDAIVVNTDLANAEKIRVGETLTLKIAGAITRTNAA